MNSIKKIIYSEKKPALLYQDSVVINLAFTNPDVYTDIPKIIYLLENSVKFFKECIYKSLGAVIRRHRTITVHNRTLKSHNLLHEVFISLNGSVVYKYRELLKASVNRHFRGENCHFTRFLSRNTLETMNADYVKKQSFHRDNYGDQTSQISGEIPRFSTIVP